MIVAGIAIKGFPQFLIRKCKLKKGGCKK